MKKKKTVPRIKRILIAVPCYQNCEPDTMKSIYDLDIPQDVETSLIFMAGYTVVQARNRIVAHSLKENYDYTLCVDSDVVLPKDLLVKLFKLGEDGAGIATGWYIKKIPSGNPEHKITEIYTLNFDKNGIKNVLEKEMPKEGVLDIAACGFGCTLVNNEVFNKAFDGMHFEYVERREMAVSEDLFFCNKAFRAGVKMVVDTSLRCPHVGKVHF